MKTYDAIIIGAGQAGIPLSKRLAASGMQVALIEKADVGGTCVNDGCTPTKTLVGIAKTMWQARRAQRYGVQLNEAGLDYGLIHGKKEAVVERYRSGLERSLLADPNITLIYGKARFSGYKQVTIEKEREQDIILTAVLIIINTGAEASTADLKGLKEVPYFTSRELLDLRQLPERLLIIGGGYIALEFAQIFSRLGSQVTVIEASNRLLTKEDEDVGEEIQRMLEAEGIDIVTEGRVLGLWQSGQGDIHVDIQTVDGNNNRSGTHLLIATGRVPNTSELALENTGVEVDEIGFIKVNSWLETTKAGIYAVGDVIKGPAFTHVAYSDFVVLADHLLGDKKQSIENRLIPYCLFTDPELGRIGMTEKEAALKGLDYSVAKMPTSAIARAVEQDETTGFIKAVVDNKTKQILGVATICNGGGELMSILQMAMMGGLSYEALRWTVFAHPTYAEAINNLFHPANIKKGNKGD